MNDPSSQWHSIRPWRPTLSLAVREITSVSATFILSSPLASSGDATTTDGTDDDTDEDILESDVVLEGEEGRRGGGNGGQQRQTQIVSDALSKGLSVKVNGTPWQRVLMKIDDEADEAVIILFGLMPGRQYDVELSIVPGENSLRSQITTELATSPPNVENGTDTMEFRAGGQQQQQQHLLSSSSPSPSTHTLVGNGTSPPTPSTTASIPPTSVPSFSLEDRRLQLSHTLSQLTSEHATLAATLKTARRESQKADAALRSEIEALKRASEKNAGLEHRARQKVLALQEAVRRTVAATEEVRAMITEVEGLLPGLEVRRRDVEGEWERVRVEAKNVKKQREEVEREETRRVEASQNEMVGLGHRMEKLAMKREKLEGEGGVLSELEEKLRRLEEERMKVESDPYGYGYDEDGGAGGDMGMSEDGGDLRRRRGSVDSRAGDSSSSDQQQLAHSSSHVHHSHPNHQNPVHHHTHHTHSRKRHSHPTNTRNTPQSQQQHPPIQRPSHSARLSLPAGPGVIHLNKGQITASSVSPSSHTPTSAAVVNSALSSRAPPFEPSRRPPLLPMPVGSSGSSPGVKSELNPGSSPFSPRSGVALAAVSASQSAPAVVGGKNGPAK